MTIDELSVLITANSSSFQKELNNTQNKVNEFAQKATTSTSSITKGFLTATIITKALGTAIRVVTSNLGDAVTRLDTLNNYTNVMSNLGINADDAQASIDRLSDKLQGLPTTLDDASLAVQRFTSANGNVKASTEMFLALNNALLAGGASTQIQATALEQLSQSYAKGKPDMMEWRTLLTAMPAQLNQVAIAMGYVSSTELGEDLRNGEISMNDFMLTLVRLNNEGVAGFQSFEQQARNSTGGVNTSIANLKTAIVRGITSIMDTIGQSNIAGFFNGIASAINAVIPYVTAFVKVIGMAVSYISSIFGGKSTTAKNVDNVSNSLNSLGASGVNASDGIDEATGSTKALKKELLGLAGFDEMTVLKETNNDSSGSGGGTTTGTVGGVGALEGIDWDIYTEDATEATDKVTEIVNKILSVLEPLRNIDFTPLKKSFDNLKSAIKPLADVINSALKIAFEDVIAPLAKFTVEKALPTFFDLLANAIKLLTPVINAFKNAGKWLLDTFLKPIGKWVGNAVISGIQGLSDAIGKLADKINKSKTAQKVLDGIATGILSIVTAYGIFKASWKIGELIQIAITAFVSFQTTIATTVTAMKTMPVASAMISSSLTALQLVFALLTGQMTLHEVATALATKAQLAFNTAMSTNPIGLVISAIALLVAGLTALVLWLNKGTEAEQEQAEAMKEKAKVAQDLNNDYKELQKTQQETINNGLAELNYTQKLSEELKSLADEKGNVAEKDRARAEFILGELNEALGTEYTMVGNQIQQYSELKTSIEDLIQQKKLEVLFEAREAEYREALINLVDTQQKKEQAYKEWQQAYEDYQEHRSQANEERLKSATEQYNSYSETYEQMCIDIQSYEDAMVANLEGNADKAEEILMDKSGYYEEYKEKLKTNAETQVQVLKENQDKAIENLDYYHKNYSEKVEGFTQDGLREAVTYATLAKEEYENVGKNMVSGLSNGIENNKNDPIKKIGGVADLMQKEFKTVNEINSPSRVYERYGQYINVGLANGLDSNSYSPINAIGRIANSIISTFTSKLSINSPSKLFEGYGKFTAVGFANGIDRNTNLAVKSMKNMASDISQVDILPSIETGNVSINRAVDISNNISSQNLYEQVQRLADKEINNHVMVKLGEDTIFDKFIQYLKNKDFETNGEVFAL